MAKKSKSKSPSRRASTPSANRSRLVRSPSRSGVTILPLNYGDLRLYHPDRFARPAPAFRRAATRLMVGPQTKTRWKDTGVLKQRQPTRLEGLSKTVQFANPRRVALCVRRKIRREVLIATGGAGKKNKKPPRRNQWSDVKC